MQDYIIYGVVLSAFIVMYLVGRSHEAKTNKLKMSSAQEVYASILLPKLTTLLNTSLAAYQQALAVKDLPPDARADLNEKMQRRVGEIWQVFEHPSIEGVDNLFKKYILPAAPATKSAVDEESYTPHEEIN